MAAIQIWSGDQVESMEELLVKLDEWKYWKEKALHVTSCEHYNMKSYTSKVVPWAKVHQMPVAQHFLMMEDRGDGTW